MFCLAEIDECSSTPCLNGATCIDEIGQFSCQCPPNLAGILCETGQYKTCTELNDMKLLNESEWSDENNLSRSSDVVSEERKRETGHVSM